MACRRSGLRGLAAASTALLAGGLVAAAPAAAASATPVVKIVSPSAGKITGGNTVTITGSGFRHVVKVKFGATAGTRIHVRSTSKLTVVAPKHAAGRVNIRVKVRSGSTVKTSAEKVSDRYSYYSPPAVTAVSPTRGSTNGGTTVTITGRNFRAITKIEFGATAGTRVHVRSTSKLTAIAPKHTAGAVNVRVIGRYGTSPTTTKDRYTYSVPPPAWHAIEAPLPAGHASAPQVDLLSVACPAAASCTAVGTYEDGSAPLQHGLIDALDGTTWVGGKTPLPAGAGSAFSSLASVACASSTSCAAVGNYGDTSQHEQALLDTRTGPGWAATKAPLPTDANASPNASLSAVACPAPGSCVAVGSYTDTTDGIQGLIETLASGTWTATEAPLPTGAGTNIETLLGHVACWTTSSCVVVGTYLDATEEQDGLIETLVAGTWHAAAAPLPADRVAADQFVVLNGLSCSAAGSCAAVGEYQDSQGQHEGLIVTITNGSADAIEAPLPANTDSPPDAALASVSCVTGSPCTAVGYYLDDSPVSQGLFESISGGSAIAAEAPLPSGATTDLVGLAAIACESGGCRTTGYYTDDTGANHGLIESLVSGTWSAINAPVPANDYHTTPLTPELTELNAVVSASGSTYVAVGQYPDSRFDNQGLIDAYS